MNFLIDVHLPISLSKFLDGQQGCSAVHVNQILQKWNTPDKEICKYADANDLVVVTKDGDFRDSYFLNGTPKKLIRIVLGNISNANLVILFEKYLPALTQISNKNSFYLELDAQQLFLIE